MPVQRRSPLPPLSAFKNMLVENDVFAISPAMFPKKLKRVDYLDIFADADRKDFMSPMKTPTQPKVVQSKLGSSPIQVYNDQANENGNTSPDTTPETNDDEPPAEGISSPYKIDLGATLETLENPHFALLSYLADVASTTEHIPQDDIPAEEEELTHGSIEDLLTAAALAESMKEEIINAIDDAEAAEEDDGEVDIISVDPVEHDLQTADVED